MRYPKPIRKGDTIGLAAPSFGAGIEPYITRTREAIRKIEAAGYRIKLTDSVWKSDGLGISTNPKDAAADVVKLYLDPEVRAIISVGGGELMNETISEIDFSVLKKAEPKWFMGYSDNTNLILPLAVLCDTASVYGPCAGSFGKEWEQPENDAFAVLSSDDIIIRGYPKFELPDDAYEEDNPLAPYHLTQEKILSSFIPDSSTPEAGLSEGIPSEKGNSFRRASETGGTGSLRRAGNEEKIAFSGILMGGCLDVLTNLCGTRYDRVREFLSSHGPVIWALEACDLNPMAIRRSVWNLREAGWFDTASGFLIGRPLASFRQEMMGVDAYNAVTDVVARFQVPVIMDVDIGHVKPDMPIVIGSQTEVNVRGNDLSLHMCCR